MARRTTHEDAEECFVDLMTAMGKKGKITDIRKRKKGGYYLGSNITGYRVMKVTSNSGSVQSMFGSDSAKDFCEKVNFTKEVLEEKKRRK